MRLATLNESGPQIKTLKANTVKLTDAERERVLAAGATWHFATNGGKPSPAIRKAVVRGKTYYFSNTHRCYQVATTLDKALEDFFEVVEPSA